MTASAPVSRRRASALRRRKPPSLPLHRHLRWLRRPPAPLPVLRPCTPGDGIERLPAGERRRLAAAARAAVAAGRFSVFLPASGAATRLFQTLAALAGAARAAGRPVASFLRGGGWKDARLFFERLPALALAGALDAALRARGDTLRRALARRDHDLLLDLLLAGPARLPKGLLPFHGAGRTALEDHLREAALLAADGRRRCRVHVTVSPDHRRSFERHFREIRSRLERDLGVRFLVRWSVQSPGTDTPVLGEDGRWVRRPDGGLVFRPGGHGALLGNLEAAGVEYAFVRNIDNVAASPGAGRAWRLALAGKLLAVRGEALVWDERLKARDGAGAVPGAADFVRRHLGVAAPRRGRRAWLMRVLDRPWRVCGMVRNTGEPGGGPFWVREGKTRSKQIVESAQAGGRGRAVFRRSTHFNPVDMVVAPRDFEGRPHRLERFANPRAVIVTQKTVEGRAARVLEHPGLWNGGMSRWNTIFVEIPAALFTPVKTVTDLLRPGHRAGR